MAKHKKVNKPNVIKLSANAKCHHGIRHPKFLLSKFKSRQHKPLKRCTRELKCPKMSRTTRDKFKHLIGDESSKAPKVNGLPKVCNDNEKMDQCACKENVLTHSVSGCEKFFTAKMKYDSFLDDDTNPQHSEYDTENEDEPLYRSFNASLLEDTSKCELITAANGNRILTYEIDDDDVNDDDNDDDDDADADDHDHDDADADDHDDGDADDHDDDDADADADDDDEVNIDSPVRLNETTDSESASPVRKFREKDSSNFSIKNSSLDKRMEHQGIKRLAREPGPSCNGENGQPLNESGWEDLDEYSYAQSDKQNQSDSSPRKKENAQSHKAKHRIYTENANSFILVLDHPAKLSLAGKIQLKVLWGCLSINGFYLGARNVFTPIYSPPTNSSLLISTYHDGTASPSTDCEKKTYEEFWKSQDVQLNLSSDEVSVVLKKTVGVHCKRLLDTACSYVERFFPNLFDINHQLPGFLSPERADIYGCQFYNAHQTNIRFVRCDKNWDELVEDVIRSTQHEGISPRIIVCGGKRVGKSTLCRYLLNALLNVCDKVSFIDGDPGQCEFTPSGLVSLMEITEPCFGPAFTHQRDAKLSFFVGGTTVANSPNHFIECICELWSHYSSSGSKKQPLLINTMGWNKGMGCELLMDMIRIVQPTHVVQINSPQHQSKNFPSLSVTHINETPGWKFDFNVEPYAHYILKSHVYDRKDFSQVTTRLISMLSYFSRLQEPLKFQSLNHLKTFKVPWSTVALHVCQLNVPNSQILYVYNASIVALCKCDENMVTSSSDPTLPKFIRDMPVCEFFGYGIVRGISMEEKCFYILTFLNDETLKKVNALLKGSISMPQELLLEQDVGGPIPYLLKRDITSSLKIGHKPVPRRNYIAKNKRMSPKKSRNHESPNFVPIMGEPICID